MQELISELKRIDDYPMIHFVIRTANDLLEKEKEQIKIAFESGWNWNSDPEKYYNETYNQDRELSKDVKDLLDNYNQNK